MSATLYLVGVGPGDPELLTLKAAKILANVDHVAFPQKPGQVSMALDIARSHIPETTQLLPIDVPMQRARAAAQSAYDQAAISIKNLLDEGQSVAYLCEGDPLFYGSAMYVLTRLSAKANIEIIPGISSLNASAASIARPLAGRNDRLKILPAPLDSECLRDELLSTEAAVIIKVGVHFDRVRKVLEQTGHADHAMIVEHASGAGQKLTPLRDFSETDRPYFSSILCYKGTEAWGK